MKTLELNADNFITIPFTTENLDRYIVRNAILTSINDAMPRLTGRLLDVGCGNMPYRKFILEKSSVKEYVGLDIENALVYSTVIRPDFTWNGQSMPFSDSEFDSAFATEVLEHCPHPQVVLKEIYRILKPGGIFFFTVPFLWPLHEVPNDEYRYTPFSLERHITNAGFKSTELKALGGWNASLAQIIGLWVKRSPMQERRRRFLSFFAKRIMKILLKRDKKPLRFAESTMITGISGIAMK